VDAAFLVHCVHCSADDQVSGTGFLSPENRGVGLYYYTFTFSHYVAQLKRRGLCDCQRDYTSISTTPRYFHSISSFEWNPATPSTTNDALAT
jgi:hypothetical protein